MTDAPEQGTATLDASGSSACDSRGLRYRWLDGAVEVCPWSSVATCDVAPATTTVYTLEAECLGSTCVPGGSAQVLVSVVREVVPSDLGNTLRAIRNNLEVAMSWSSTLGARTYNLYRQALDKKIWPLLPHSTDMSATTTRLPDVPTPPKLYFYRVAGVSCLGVEGP